MVKGEYQNADQAVKDLYEQLEYIRDKHVSKHKQRRYYAKPCWSEESSWV